MEGTIILLVIFLLVDLYIIDKYHQSCNELKDKHEWFFAILGAIFILAVLIGESHIVIKQYKFDRDSKSKVFHQKENNGRVIDISFYWGSTGQLEFNKGLH